MFLNTAENTLFRTASEINSAMIRVYNYMFMAVLISMVVGGLITSSPAAMAFFFTGWMKWVTIFAPLVAVIGITIALNADPPKQIAQLMLAGFSALMGLSFAAVFTVYTLGSIVSAFMGAAALFGTMSLYGYFTKRDLTSMGQFLFVGMIAILIASIINLFVGNTVVQMVISALAIIIFTGLTAYDTQKIREMLSLYGSDAQEVQGALTLYLDFVNIFLNLLQLFGGKKE